MDILIISTNRNRYPMPVMPLGACMVAEAAAKAGHRVRLLDLMFARHPLRAVAAELGVQQPDLIGLSIRNIDNNDMQQPVFYLQDLTGLLEIIRRDSKAPLVLGGAAVSVMPEEMLRFTGASCAICGEGEEVFPELIEFLAEGRLPQDLPGLAWLEGDRFRMNSPSTLGCSRRCSVPNFRRWLDFRAYRRHLATVPLQTKLGCHFRCVYCTYRKIEGNTYRLLEPASIVEEIKKLERLGFRDVEFVDNVFNSPHHHATEICEGLARSRHRVRLHSIELNPVLLDDALISIMERAGFVGVGLTVESASPLVLRGLNKGFSAEQVYHAAEVIGRHRLSCLWIFLFGGPGETPRTVKETLAFAKYVIRPKDAAFFNTGIRVYPGTKLEKIARRQGVLELPARQMLKPVFYISPEVEEKWIRREVKRAMASHLNFIDGDSIGLTCLPAINFLSYGMGVRPPLWRYSRHIRRGLRWMGMEV